jgi:hypothetical protein
VLDFRLSVVNCGFELLTKEVTGFLLTGLSAKLFSILFTVGLRLVLTFELLSISSLLELELLSLVLALPLLALVLDLCL